MTTTGADIVVGHPDPTTGGDIGAYTAKSLDDCVAVIDEWSATARSIREDVRVLCHGGPISTPEGAAVRALPRDDVAPAAWCVRRPNRPSCPTRTDVKEQ